MSSGNGALAVREAPSAPLATLPPEILEKVVVGGDLKRLDALQRVAYYKARCEAAGLDVRTRPFEYLELNGKLVLYATKSCTDALAGMHALSVDVVRHGRQDDLGIYLAEARVRFPTGRSVDDIGAVPIGGLRPADLCNAMMKAVTKSKRRAILSACGLGDVIDESELDTIPRDRGGRLDREHHAVNHDNDTGHGRTGAYAAPEDVRRYQAWLAEFVQGVNAKWLDKNTDESGEVRPGVKELLSTWQVSGHVCKWARAEGLINAPESPRAAQMDKLAAVVFLRNAGGAIAEAEDYARRKWREAKLSLAPPEPRGDFAGIEPEDASQAPAVDPEDYAEPGEPEDAWEAGRE